MLDLQAAGEGESAKARGFAIVRMTFQFGTKREQIVPGEICPRNFVQGMKHAESHGYAAAKPSSNWNIASNIAGKLKGLAYRFESCVSIIKGWAEGRNERFGEIHCDYEQWRGCQYAKARHRDFLEEPHADPT